MTVCRYCGAKIEPGYEDDIVRNASRNAPSFNQVDEWWMGEPDSSGLRWHTCNRDTPDVWHEPLIESISDILDHLRLMESDLRP